MANPNLTIIPKVAKLGKKVISILGCNPSPSKQEVINCPLSVVTQPCFICSDTSRNKYIHYWVRKKVRFEISMLLKWSNPNTSTVYTIFFCRRILLDTGDGDQPEYFLNLKKSLNFDKISIKDIILSHWHPDHVGGTKEILKSAEV